MMNRQEVIEAALDCITNDRADQYGDAKENFDNIARLWRAYLKIDISDFEVIMLMILLKVARTKSSQGHSDNYVDIIGYAALASELAAAK